MRHAIKLLSGFAAVAASAGALWMAGLAPAIGADHFDPPTRTDPNTTATPDVAADIADVYVFPTATGIVVSVDFGGPSAATLPAFYDRDLDFNLNISNAGSRTDSEFVINWRFGADPTRPNAFGIRGLRPYALGGIYGERILGAEKFHGFLDNTTIFELLRDAL